MTRFQHRIRRRLSGAHRKLTESPIAYRLASGAFWSLLGGIVSRLFAVASSIVVARIVGKEGFGEFGMVQSTMGLFGVLAGFGLGATATKFVAQCRRSDPARAGNISNLTLLVSLASGAMLAAACALFSPWLARETLQRPDMAGLLQAGSLLLFCSTLNSVMLGILAGFEAFQRVARINIWQGVAAPLVAIPLVVFFGVAGAVAALTVNAALGMLLCAVALRSHYKDCSMSAAYHRSIWSEWPVLWRFSLPTMLSGLMVAPVTWLTNLILVSRPGGYGELGLFNAANQWRAVILLLPGLLASVMLPVLSEAHGADSADFTKAVALNLRATWIVCLPLTVMVIVLNKPLTTVFGRGFSDSAPVMALLMVSCFLMVVNSTVGTALAGSGRMWTGLAMNTAWGASLIAAAYFMVPSLGALGLAAAYLAAYLLHTVWQMLYVEVKLARSAVSTQWKLILFSVLLLAAAVRCALTPSSYLASAALFLLSLCPALWALLRNLPGRRGIAVAGDLS